MGASLLRFVLSLFVLLLVCVLVTQRSIAVLPSLASSCALQCNDTLRLYDKSRSSARNYPLVIGIFTGEVGTGYEGYKNQGYRSRRDTVRSSWMKEAVDSGVPAFFVMSAWNLSQDHREEAAWHKDILLLDDPDGLAWGYRGLVHKTLITLQFMAQQCASFVYFLKADDDTFVHVPNMLSTVHNSPTTLVMMGYLQPHGEVLVDGGVWDNREFLQDTGLSAYPNYFLGGGYLMTADVVRALGSLSRTIPMQRWPVEDTTLSTWIVGWNLTRININNRYLDFHFIKQTKWARKFCRDDWLIVHHIDVVTWKRLTAKCHRVYALSLQKDTDDH